MARNQTCACEKWYLVYIYSQNYKHVYILYRKRAHMIAAQITQSLVACEGSIVYNS